MVYFLRQIETTNNLISKTSAALLLILSVAVFSCRKPNKHSHLVHNKENFSIELLHINLSLLSCDYAHNSDTITWNYPYQVVFLFQIINNTNDTLVFAANEHYFLAQTGKKYGVFRLIHKGAYYNLLCNKIIEVLPRGNNAIVSAYVIDLPIFERIYSRKEFHRFVMDLLTKSSIYYFVINDDIDGLQQEGVSFVELVHNPIRVKLWNEFSIRIFSEDKVYSITEIGYPLDSVPDHIEIIKPIPGIE